MNKMIGYTTVCRVTNWQRRFLCNTTCSCGKMVWPLARTAYPHGAMRIRTNVMLI